MENKIQHLSLCPRRTRSCGPRFPRKLKCNYTCREVVGGGTKSNVWLIVSRLNPSLNLICDYCSGPEAAPRTGAMMESKERVWGGANVNPNRLKVSAPHFTADGDFTMLSFPPALYLPFSHLSFETHWCHCHASCLNTFIFCCINKSNTFQRGEMSSNQRRA